MIIKPYKLNRSQMRTILDDGRIVRTCFGPHNPVWYYSKHSKMEPIDLSSIDYNAKCCVGKIIKKDANIRTLGIRFDLMPKKFFGLRKDDDQYGERQLETSLVSLKIDGHEQKLRPKRIEYENPTTVNFGNFRLYSDHQKTRLYIPYRGFDSFELKLKIDLTGLSIRKHEYANEFWIEDKNGELFCRIRQPNFYYKDHDLVEDLPEKVIDHDIDFDGDSIIYTKYSTMPLKSLQSSIDIPDVLFGALIDAEYYYSTTSDGSVSRTNVPPETFQETHDAEIGDTILGDGWIYQVGCYAKYGSYTCQRGFYFIDTSDILYADSASFIVQTPNNNCFCYYLSAGPHTSESPLSYGSYWSRHTLSEWDHAKIQAWGPGTFNMQLSDIEPTITKPCIIDWSNDYNNDVNFEMNSVTSFYSAEYETVNHRPKIEIIEGTTSLYNIYNGVQRPGEAQGLDDDDIYSLNGMVGGW